MHHGCSLGDSKAQHPTRRGLEAAIARVPVVTRGATGLGASLYLVAGQIAVVRHTSVVEALCCSDMGIGERTLEVRALEMLVVGVNADPRQRIDDALRPLRLIACFVGVLDPQDERAALA
ncbi:unannotated protein [freshwater metagenome]|uniref:Unannotated protein n=1 Tax=freshwater metagenome TaxID=449393 RepID=A0A6J7FL25_9ZZZZ